jgi:hypothetical protein
MKEINVNYKHHFTQNQIDNINKESRRHLATYNKLNDENEKLNHFMITIQPLENTIDGAINARKHFIEKLNNTKSNTKYFSSIETALRNEDSDEYKYSTLENKEKMDTPNLHDHFQIWTKLSKERVEKLLNNLDENICHAPKLTVRQKKDAKYFYVVKNLMTKNWKELYYFKTECKNKTIYTSSQVGKNILTKIYDYFRTFYKEYWNSKKEKNKEINRLKDSDNIIMHKGKSNKYSSRYYNEISIPNSKIKVYIRKIFKAVRDIGIPKMLPYKIKRFNQGNLFSKMNKIANNLVFKATDIIKRLI